MLVLECYILVVYLNLYLREYAARWGVKLPLIYYYRFQQEAAART
jgi:hypothetical protein